MLLAKVKTDVTVYILLQLIWIDWCLVEGKVWLAHRSACLHLLLFDKVEQLWQLLITVFSRLHVYLLLDIYLQGDILIDLPLTGVTAFSKQI